MEITLKNEYRQIVAPALREQLGHGNVHQIPRIEKVVINSSVGSAPDIKNALEEVAGELTAITGQKPAVTKAKLSISNFKLRQGQEIGLKVTLRGDQMYEFLLRFIRVAIPNIRDFRGVSPKSFDGNGNYTLGVKDHSIFPEVDLDKVKRTIGMDVTIVTSAKTDAEAKALLDAMGMPFTDRKKPEAAAAS